MNDSTYMKKRIVALKAALEQTSPKDPLMKIIWDMSFNLIEDMQKYIDKNKRNSVAAENVLLQHVCDTANGHTEAMNEIAALKRRLTYTEAELRLTLFQRDHEDDDPGEDDLMDAACALWYELLDEDRAYLDARNLFPHDEEEG